MSTHGSCLCGAVSYKIDGSLRDVIACHCNQCRKQTGHYYAATNVADADIKIDGGINLTWYRASPDARRGFCSICGSALFWKRDDDSVISVLAGSLDDKAEIKLSAHIYVADKGKYYEIDDDLPKFDQGR